MTTQDHNRVIGIMHLIYGGFNALVWMIALPFFLIVGGLAAFDPTGAPGGVAVLVIFGAILFALAVLYGLLPILVGYGMLKRRSWARTWGIIAACFEALSFPFGTALCAYTLWFLLGPGEHFHREAASLPAQGWRSPLPDGSTFGREAGQASTWAGRQPEYVPPPQPPDWRGE